MTAETLILAWGNPSRGDDALGPRFLERIEALAAQHPEWGRIECLGDFQLQIEHALDLRDRRRVLFVDASREAAAPYTVAPVVAARDISFTSHALSPQAVLQVWTQTEPLPPPPCRLLAIRGERFELGAALSAAAATHLDAALNWARQWLALTAAASGRALP